MHPYDIVNALLLCVVNFSLMVAGILVNSVVVISLWRSSQLRKKPCYFTILVLSTFDLVSLTITHPVLILWTVLWSMETFYEEIKTIWEYIAIFLGAFALFALLTLNIERFLALNYPFFHQTAVTKRRIILFQALLMIVLLILSPLFYFDGRRIGNILIAVGLLLSLLVLIYLNYKMFTIVKAKKQDEKVATTITSEKMNKRRKFNFKSVSTCSLVVGCFFFCSVPQITYSALRVSSDMPGSCKDVLLFNIWSNTFLAMNSTINCLIFFWKNSTLRRAGMKRAECFQSVTT